MGLKSKISLLFFSLLLCFSTAQFLRAEPGDSWGPDNSFYQRVKNLENHGLLEPQDQAILDAGQRVTPDDLISYVEKAKARLDSQEFAFYREQAPVRMSAPEIVIPTATPQPTPTPSIDPELKRQIEDLLRQLKEAQRPLHERLSANNDRLEDRQTELRNLESLQDEVDVVFKKSNRYVKMPIFGATSDFTFENMQLYGPLVEQANKGVNAPATTLNLNETGQDFSVTMTAEFGGKSQMTVGLLGDLDESNVNATGNVWGVIITADTPLPFNGSLGNWSTHFSTNGIWNFDNDFTMAGVSNNDYTNMFEPAQYYPPQNIIFWNNYMTQLVVTPAVYAQNGNLSRNYNPRPGFAATGLQVPLLPEDSKVVLHIGRKDFSSPAAPPSSWPARWDEGINVEGPFLGPENVRVNLSAVMVNDNPGINPPKQAQENTANYGIRFNWDLEPLSFNFQSGFSHFGTGIFPASGPTTLEGWGLEGYVDYYPFRLTAFSVDPSFTSDYGRIVNSVDYSLYGVNDPGTGHSTGYIGRADTIENNRWGWYASFGWQGRKLNWMKNWPKFLDSVVVSLLYGQKQEYVPSFNRFDGNSNVEFEQVQTLYYNTYPPFQGLWIPIWASPGPFPDALQYATTIIQNGGTASSLIVYPPYYFPNFFNFEFDLPAHSDGTPILPLSPNNQPEKIVVKGKTKNSFYYPNPTLFLKSFNYLTLNTKIQFNKIFNLPSPVYGVFFFTDNKVSGSGDPILPSIPDLFDQTIVDFTGMVQPIRYVNVMAQYAWEEWKSDYTYPLTDIRTDIYGLGFSYDLPWGSSWFDFRYKHMVFTDKYAPLGSFQGDQFWAGLNFLFPQ